MFEKYLLEFLVVLFCGFFLYVSFIIYTKFIHLFNNWRKLVVIAFLCSVSPFVVSIFLPENNILLLILFPMSALIACFLFLAVAFAYGRAKKEEKIFSVKSSSVKYKSPSDFYIREVDKCIEFFDNKIFTQRVGKEIKNSFKKFQDEFNKNEKYIEIDGTTNINSVRLAASFVILEMVENLLISGEYHIHRGVLTDDGNSLLQIWDLMMQKYLKLNPTIDASDALNNEDWAQKQRVILLENIKNVG